MRWSFSKSLCPKLAGSWLPKPRRLCAHLCHQHDVSLYRCAWLVFTVSYQWGQDPVWIPTGRLDLQVSRVHLSELMWHSPEHLRVCVMAERPPALREERDSSQRGRRMARLPLILEVSMLDSFKDCQICLQLFFLKLIQKKQNKQAKKPWATNLWESGPHLAATPPLSTLELPSFIFKTWICKEVWCEC